MSQATTDDKAAGQPEKAGGCRPALDRVLPFDILCDIFVFAQWPSLARVSRGFHEASQSMAVRARYCLVEFGRRRVLDGRLGLVVRRPQMLSQATVLLLLNLGADPCADDQWILRHACAQGWTPIVRKLLSMRRNPALPAAARGAVSSLDDWRGAGAVQPSTSTAQALLDVHADDDAALRIAARLGHCAVLRVLADAGAAVDAAGGEALALAASNCRLDAARVLLELGADARASQSQALRAAVLTGDAALEVTRLLIAHGADVRVLDDSCLMAACYKGDGQLPPGLTPCDSPIAAPPRRYRKAGTCQASLGDSTRPVSHIDTVRLLLAHGADANAQGGRCLVYACARGWERTVAALLAHGADLHVRDDEPLREAAAHGHLRLLRLLLAAGADLHTSSDASLRCAASGGHVDVVCELLAAGIDARAPGGVLALRAAARGGWVRVVTTLVAAGADSADPDFRACALRSRSISRALNLSVEPPSNRFIFQ
ncbi:hypothetical protein H4R20_002891 [Coemansia guatemalensis]|uniref:Ankyrin n=1 Tax=Coemansia guatemalensis TaxID=2761395 RepID=A0A9W8HUQ0_9FUNG|nr:hypothetical protein H4R20_002891 [Coemansia guatemalensis]